MTVGEHSNLLVLRACAHLISDIELEETEAAVGLSIDRLDYHGISLLCLEKRRLSGELKAQLNSRRAMMVANEAMKKMALSDLFSAFSTAGLNRHILFKGTALAYSVYKEPWLRPRSDSDCLIDYVDFEAYESIFLSLGYQQSFAIRGKYVSYQTTFYKALSKHSLINIDLHWKINNRQVLAHTFDVSELLGSSSSIPDLSECVRIPHPVDSVLISCVHRVGHHHQEERLIWLYDIHRLLQEFSEQDWELMTHKACDKKIAGITLDALLLCNQLFDTEISSSTEVALRAATKKPEASQLFLNRDLPEWKHFLNDLRSMKRWRDRFGFVRETLFPDRQYIRQKMQTSNLFLAYTQRGLRGLERFMSISKN